MYVCIYIECLRHLELGRAFVQARDLDLTQLKFIKKSLKLGASGCTSQEGNSQKASIE
jgi:hypothetical protein